MLDPDAIAWLLKSHPELSDAAISRMIGTTKPTINAVRERTHWNSANIKPQHPVLLGLCTQKELEEALSKVRKSAKSAQPVPVEDDAAADGGEAADPAMPDLASVSAETESETL